MNTQLTRLTPALRVLLALLSLALVLPDLHAASATPPDRMTYQGYLVDANGVPLGNTAPVNHTVEFRIYDASTGGTTKWGEVQTVTVDKGYFSVLLGDGSVLDGAPSGALSGVFQGADASDRFISVKVSSLAGSSEILPRLRFVTSPYAYMATTLPPGAITNGLFAAASITGDKLATNTLSAANFSTNLGLWTATGTNIYRTNGFVGIGTATPGAPLDVLGQVQVLNNGTISSIGSKNSYRGLIETSYGPGNDRYGLAQGPSGVLALYTAQPVGIIQFGQATGSNSFSPQMTILNNGNVGIGTATPGTRLDVRLSDNSGGDVMAFGSQTYVMGRLGEDTSANRVYLANTYVAGSGGQIGFRTGVGAAPTDRMTILGNGFVGIGTTSPSAPLEVNGTGTGFNLANASYYAQGAFGNGYNLNGFVASIKANWHIYTSASFYCGSDARIKNVQGLSDSADDLRKLTQIEITDYLYKDQVAHKSVPQKKVIAQQVEKVFPQAVSKTTDVVPDIYQKAIFTNGWVQLATDLKVGERVKLMGENDGGVHEVLEVREGAFRTGFKPTNEKVFVYGREVKDFRSVDYEAIAMLNVSATQELARKVKAQEAELTELRAELAKLRGEKKSLTATVTELKERDDAREARLARLEKALDSRAGVIEAKAAGLRSDATARPAGDLNSASK